MKKDEFQCICEYKTMYNYKQMTVYEVGIDNYKITCTSI